jgi:adenylate cyclase
LARHGIEGDAVSRPRPSGPDRRDEEFWRHFLEEGGDSMASIGRRVFKRIPSEPRCRMCAAPFAGPGAPMMRLIGKRPSQANPSWCTSCTKFMTTHHGGAEVVGTMLFADIRGSTSLAERMTPGEFHHLLDRYFTTATKVVFDHDGYIDKFVGDELVALFFPLLTGERHTARAVAAAEALMRATGHADPDGPWVPIGAGVNYGQAWFGAVGDGSHVELTAVGDTVNVAARLAAAAGPGEILVSAEAAIAAGLDRGIESRSFDLKGKRAATDAVSIRIGPDRQG